MAAEFRSVQTRMWREDEWFQTLPTDARLLFIYLFTNPSASVSGIYRLPLRTIEFESGIPAERVKELMDQFNAANKVHYGDGVVWVVKMRENQIPGAISPQVQKRLNKDIASIPSCPVKTAYLRHYGYPIDTLSIHVTTDTDTDTLTDTHTDAAASGANGDGPDLSHMLGKRQAAMSYHVGEAAKCGVDAKTFREMVDRLMDAVGWRALVEDAQDDRKLSTLKDQVLAMVRMRLTTVEQLDELLANYRVAYDWRKTPPTPQSIAEYASQTAKQEKPRNKKSAWVLDQNGNRVKEVAI